MVYVVIKKDLAIIQADEQLIARLMDAVEIPEYKIINLKHYRLIDKNGFHICLGIDAYNGANVFVTDKSKLIKVSEIEQLHPLPKNSDHRAKTYYDLKELSQYIKLLSNKDKNTKQEINPSQVLTNLNALELNYLKEELLDNKITGFTALNTDGKKVRIHIDQADTVREDINITFQELIAAKLISELLNNNNPIIISKKEK